MVYEVPGGGDYQWQQASGLNETMYDRLRFANGTQQSVCWMSLWEELCPYLPIYLHIDNSAAIAVLTSAAGSWRTRHLRLHANWIKEKIQMCEIQAKHEPWSYPESQARIGLRS